MNDAALAQAIKKIRKLRLIDHIPLMDEAPPALTFLAVMKSGMGGCYDDAALEYIFRRFIKYYEAAGALSSTQEKSAAEMHVSGRTKAGNDIGGI